MSTSTHSSPLISIPPKQTEEVDFGPSIKHIIGHTYGENPSSYAEEIGVLGRCRGDAVKGAGSDVTARDLLYKYFGQLELLELRFAEIKVPFPWQDAFTLRSTTQSSLAFEKASIIFLLSSHLSRLASSSPRSSPTSVKTAFNSLKSAAGMLVFINENFLHAPSTDLSREVVKLLTGIMITQAGEVVLEKLIGEKKAPGMISKIAQGVGAGYTALVEEVNTFQGKGIIDRSWLQTVTVKSKLFLSIAQYHRSQHDDSKDDHGASLVRLGLALNLAKEANTQAQAFFYSFLPTQTSTLPADAATNLAEICKSHLSFISDAKAQADKNNDLVYHALPPSEASLPSIEVLEMAKPTPIQEIYALPEVSGLIGADIFGRLVPLEVHTSASVYSEEKAKLARGETERCRVSEGEARVGMEELGVLNKLAKYKAILDGPASPSGDGGASREAKRWAEEVIGKEREGRTEDKMRKLQELKDSSREILEGLGRELDEESRECEKMRVKYAHLWTQSPSASHTRQFRTDIKQHLESLTAADSSNSELFSLWSSIQPDVDLLRGGPARVDDVFRGLARGGDVPAKQPIVNLVDFDVVGENGDGGLGERERVELETEVDELEERVERMGKVRAEREEVLKDLKEKIQADDVSHLLLLNRRTQGIEPTLFATELEKFKPYQTRISAAIASQVAILGEMKTLIKKIEHGKGVRDVMRKGGEKERRRDEFEGRLRSGFEGFMEVRRGLDKGLHFYESIQNLINSLQREARSFVTTRTSERNRLASDADARNRIASSPPPVSSPLSQSRDMGGLESQMGGMNLSSAPSSWSSPSKPSPAAPSPYPAPPAPYPSLPSAKPSTSPYDFGAMSNLPSAFSSSTYSAPTSSQLPPPPLSRPAVASPYQTLPPPPPPPTQNNSYYGGAPATSQDYRTSSSSPYPPPPSQPYQQHSPYPAPPSRQTSAYSSPPPPAPPQQYSSYQYQQPSSQPSYPAPPSQQPQSGYPSYPSTAPSPPSQGQYPYFPPVPPSNPYQQYQR